MILDRITVDIDSYVPNAHLRALRAYYELRRMDIVDEVIVHVSTSGKGLHIEGLLSEVLTDEQRLTIRRDLNDDAARAHLDELRMAVGHAGDVFWAEKEGNDGEREQMPDIWSALDRLEATRASDYSRIKALALNGRRAIWDTHGLNRPSLAEGGR